MRNLVYVLSDNTVVTTLREAQASGLEYTMKTVTIAETPVKLTEKQRAMRVSAK